jgi:hypothetical protein
MQKNREARTTSSGPVGAIHVTEFFFQLYFLKIFTFGPLEILNASLDPDIRRHGLWRRGYTARRHSPWRRAVT